MCDLVGRGSRQNHTLDECFANPLSMNAMPSIVRLRWAQIKKNGLDMPECMKQYD